MFHIKTHLIFILGFISGTLISVLLQSGKNELEKDIASKKSSYENWFNSKQFRRKYLPFDTLRYSNDKHKFMLEAEVLFNSISVLCLILISRDKNLRSIKNTWGRGCNNVNSIEVNKKPSIFPLKQNRSDTSWIKLCEAIKRVPEVHDWILVTNDDTFVIMENLRYFLASKNASENLYLGYTVKFWNTLYNSGKAGYVLSKGVVQTMQKTACSSSISYRNQEDFMLGHHLVTLNIAVTKTEDENGFSLFHPYNLNRLLFPQRSHYVQKSFYETKCCSRNIITFNAIEADKMYTYYYLLYILQIFHYGHLGNRQPQKLSDKTVWQSFLKEHNLPLNISSEKYFDAWENLIDSPNSFGRNMKREDYTDDA